MDYYDDPYQFNDAHYFDVQFPSVSDVWETCMYPTIAQIANYFATFIVWNVVFRVASQSSEFSQLLFHHPQLIRFHFQSTFQPNFNIPLRLFAD